MVNKNRCYFDWLLGKTQKVTSLKKRQPAKMLKMAVDVENAKILVLANRAKAKFELDDPLKRL